MVAGEVGSLAKRSSDAASEIKALIITSVEQVDAGMTLVDQAGDKMSDCVDSVQGVTNLMADISHASIEQNAGVSQIGDDLIELDRTTQENDATPIPEILICQI